MAIAPSVQFTKEETPRSHRTLMQCLPLWINPDRNAPNSRSCISALQDPAGRSCTDALPHAREKYDKCLFCKHPQGLPRRICELDSDRHGGCDADDAGDRGTNSNPAHADDLTHTGYYGFAVAFEPHRHPYQVSLSGPQRRSPTSILRLAGTSGLWVRMKAGTPSGRRFLANPARADIKSTTALRGRSPCHGLIADQEVQ